MTRRPPYNGIILSSDAALACWKDFRAERQAGNSTPERQERLAGALREFSFLYLWPFRIVLAHQPGQKPLFYLLVNWGGHGYDEELWQMTGWHREKDMLRLAVRFRNIYLSGQNNYIETGQLDSSLMGVMNNVRRLMDTYEKP